MPSPGPSRAPSRKIEPYIYEITGKRVVSYSVEVEPNNSIGRFRSLMVARLVRDEQLAKHGPPPRRRRPMGTGHIYFSGGRYVARYDKLRVGTGDTRKECEALLRDYLAALPQRTWCSGHKSGVSRTLPCNELGKRE